MLLVIFGGLIIILPLWYIWDWWTEGILSGTEALCLSILLFLVLGQMAAFEALRSALFLLLLASAILLPFLSTTLEKMATGKLKSDMMAKYRHTIAVDPMNTAARVQLAETLYSVERLDEAIAELEAAFGVAKLTFREERLLAEWKEEQRLRDTRNLICQSCGKENERGVQICPSCGRPLPQSFAADWMRSGGAVAAVRAWALAVAAVAALLFIFALFPALPSPSPPIVTVLGFLAWLTFYVLHRRKRPR